MPVYPVKNNLVVNGDFSDGNIGFSSDYSFVPAIFSETQYTICLASAMDASTQYPPGNLFTGFVDPLGIDSNVMLVNGATAANQQIWSEYVTVTPHTDYVFSFYAVDVNVDRSSLAVIQASINGVSGATLQTTDDWQQASFVWNSGDNTSASISLTDLNTSGGANDFAMDKISFAELALPPVITSESLSNGKVTLTGTAEANDTISVYDGSTLLGTTTTGSDDTWSFTTKKVSNAVHIYTADAADLAGNVVHSSNEAILGSSKADTLIGTSADDIIFGQGGNDRITGGLGADTLTGGSGKDTFAFNAISDSTPSSHDTITDFIHGQDKIDFTNIAGINASHGVPTFQGNLTGSGDLTLNPHSIAYIEVSGNTVVLINTTNAAEIVTSSNVSAANMEIDLVGNHLHLTNTDFLHV